MLHLFTAFQALGKPELLKIFKIDEVMLHLFIENQSVNTQAKASTPVASVLPRLPRFLEHHRLDYACERSADISSTLLLYKRPSPSRRKDPQFGAPKIRKDSARESGESSN